MINNINKKILLKTLLPIATVTLLGGGIASSLILTNCSKNDPSHYVGNIYGTDWKGHESGEFLCIPENRGGYTLDLSNSSIAYRATNWVIPYKVKDSEGKEFYLKKIIGESLERSHLVLTGTLTIPNSVTNIGDYAFNGCSGLTGSLTISNSVTSIGDGAFYNCSGFNGNLTIPNSVISIGVGAFTSCSGLTGSLTIGSRVTSIAAAAFQSCSGLTGSLIIPNSVISIGVGAFANCSGLTKSLTIPNSVISISSGAFTSCSGFTKSLTIPNSVISIGVGAFANCSGFANVTLAKFSTPPEWTETYIFQNFSPNGTVSTSGGSYSADEALAYLISKGLPSTWTVA